MGILATHAPDIWISLIMNEYCTKCLTLHLGETFVRMNEKDKFGQNTEKNCTKVGQHL